MNWKEINLKAILLIANNKVKLDYTSKNFGTVYLVGDEDKYYNVRIVTENGFNKVLCNCKNASLCPESFCAHKLAVVMKCQQELYEPKKIN